MLGIDRKKLLDKGLSSFVPPSSQDTLYFHYRLAAKGAESRRKIFVVVRRKDGSEIQVQLKSDLVRGDAGIWVQVDIDRCDRPQESRERNAQHSGAVLSDPFEHELWDIVGH